MRILVACGNGSGTSLMLSKSVEKAMAELGVPVTSIYQTAISEGKNTAKTYDAVFTPLNFLQEFNHVKDKIYVFGIRNIMSAQEIKEAIEERDLVEKYG